MRNVDAKLLQFNNEYIYQKDFVNSMNLAFRELSDRLSEITSKCDVFSLQITNERLPKYLTPGNHFLGQYLITDVISFIKIEKHKLMHKNSVFGDHNLSFSN